MLDPRLPARQAASSLLKNGFSEVVASMCRRALCWRFARERWIECGARARTREALHGSLTYATAGSKATIRRGVEVIEHLDPPRLTAFERRAVRCARPGLSS